VQWYDVTVPTASSLSSPQLAVLQKPGDPSLPQPAATPRKDNRPADQAPSQPAGGRGRLLDIVV